MTKKSILTKEDAVTILETNGVCENESIGPDSRELLKTIFEQHPDLIIKFLGVFKQLFDLKLKER